MSFWMTSGASRLKGKRKQRSAFIESAERKARESGLLYGLDGMNSGFRSRKKKRRRTQNYNPRHRGETEPLGSINDLPSETQMQLESEGRLRRVAAVTSQGSHHRLQQQQQLQVQLQQQSIPRVGLPQFRPATSDSYRQQHQAMALASAAGAVNPYLTTALSQLISSPTLLQRASLLNAQQSLSLRTRQLLAQQPIVSQVQQHQPAIQSALLQSLGATNALTNLRQGLERQDYLLPNQHLMLSRLGEVPSSGANPYLATRPHSTLSSMSNSTISGGEGFASRTVATATQATSGAHPTFANRPQSQQRSQTTQQQQQPSVTRGDYGTSIGAGLDAVNPSMSTNPTQPKARKVFGAPRQAFESPPSSVEREHGSTDYQIGPTVPDRVASANQERTSYSSSSRKRLLKHSGTTATRFSSSSSSSSDEGRTSDNQDPKGLLRHANVKVVLGRSPRIQHQVATSGSSTQPSSWELEKVPARTINAKAPVLRFFNNTKEVNVDGKPVPGADDPTRVSLPPVLDSGDEKDEGIKKRKTSQKKQTIEKRNRTEETEGKDESMKKDQGDESKIEQGDDDEKADSSEEDEEVTYENLVKLQAYQRSLWDQFATSIKSPRKKRRRRLSSKRQQEEDTAGKSEKSADSIQKKSKSRRPSSAQLKSLAIPTLDAKNIAEADVETLVQDSLREREKTLGAASVLLGIKDDEHQQHTLEGEEKMKTTAKKKKKKNTKSKKNTKTNETG